MECFLPTASLGLHIQRSIMKETVHNKFIFTLCWQANRTINHLTELFHQLRSEYWWLITWKTGKLKQRALHFYQARGSSILDSFRYMLLIASVGVLLMVFINIEGRFVSESQFSWSWDTFIQKVAIQIDIN